MNINEAISKLELAGFTVVDEKECSLDNLARLIKENYGVEVKEIRNCFLCRLFRLFWQQ